LASISLSVSLLFPVVEGFWPLLLVTLVSFSAFSAMMPLGESLTMQGTTTHHLDYGRVRLWGSLSSVLVAGLGGLVLFEAPRWAILLSCLVGLSMTLAASLYLSDIRSKRTDKRSLPIRSLLVNRVFLLFLATASLTEASHMIYHGFVTLYWRASGLSGGLIGCLWAEGVIASLLMFTFGGTVLSRFGSGRLMAAAAVAGAIRWTVLAMTTDPWILAAAQLLHALTFSAKHLAAMHFISHAVPFNFSARAQSVYSSVTMGIVPGISMAMAGHLYQAFGGDAFLVMSIFALAGFALSLLLLRQWNGGLILGKSA